MKNLINLQQLLLLIFFILYIYLSIIHCNFNNILYCCIVVVELEQQRNLDFFVVFLAVIIEVNITQSYNNIN